MVMHTTPTNMPLGYNNANLFACIVHYKSKSLILLKYSKPVKIVCSIFAAIRHNSFIENIDIYDEYKIERLN